MQVHVEYATQCHNCPLTATIKKWVNATVQGNHTLSIKIVDEQEITVLNHHFRHKDKSTNVLSFPCTLPAHLRGNTLGDIAICAPVVEKEAQLQQKSVTAHWAHLVIHGTLHLLGYDHETETEAYLMEARESDILTGLGFPDPYKVEKTHD